jgi:hypothetical protein
LTGRPRDVDADAQTVISGVLRYADAPAPHFLAGKILVALQGAHIALIDRTPPADPNADALTRPAHITPAATASTEYQQAKAALTKTRRTAPRGLTPPRQCGCGCVRGFCQCAGDPCPCAPCPLCHPTPEEPQETPQ